MRILNLPFCIIFVGVIALTTAYVAEYVFGLLPCVLCVYQRIPYFIIIMLGTISLLLNGRWFVSAVALCGVVLLIGAGIAFFHLGVENGKFTMGGGCVNNDEVTESLDLALQQIVGKPTIPCDKPQFVLFGISMAGWNFMFSFFSGLYLLGIAWKMWSILNRKIVI